MNEIPETGRIVLLTTTHRVAPGLLSWPAWEALRTADRVLCADPAHPQLPYVRDAGIEAEAGVVLDAHALVDECAEGPRTIVVVASAEGEPALTDGLARLAGSGRRSMPELELLPGSYDLPGARLLDVVQVMDRIRRECPWSAPRTHEDLLKYGVEEVYELIDAIERGDRAELREELGDVLLQVVFHARIAQDDESEPFGIDDVAGTLVDKLVHRHPHVFGDDVAETAEDVKAHWMRRKAAEKHERTSVTEGVPLGQPALSLAAKLAGRARAAGLTVPVNAPEGAGDAGGRGGTGGTGGTGGDGGTHGAGGVGYALLALAVEAEREGIDPEAALRAAARAYRETIQEREREAPRGS
ncbi:MULTISPECIES: nucleoside triphosphate pyrophosphohydrolase [unclassified Streptomyces]|uniref:nucleoside triphosphate pyrophosphohydrolase n=1 Tax=unclassified Streptomyces TaxID=2593676 RepID=UPI002DDC69DC|nr:MULTISPECIES: nucleoside triphosphate pyrophosphohydrolase [unclassified Streptomyces]WSA94271.1 nucleoside triphosphate pyrophosphohydrolase [Streptomyces sp. NBC_01795]WSS13107.1 nucleoside triphosphate pyrophosphohydrolase [Streptomyces sp. NBC_01186]WSS41891.1 nucleoside triphosphate pyrophosphohydrolase [Streptomyces sp. NBC_01187]